MSKELFREQAKENFSSMADTTAPVKNVTSSEKLISVLVFLSVVFVAIWFFMGRITETVGVDCIISTDGGNISIYSSQKGEVSDVFVWKNKRVSAGDVIAIIPNKEMIKRIEEAQESGESAEVIEQLRQEYYSSSIIKTLKSGIIRSVVSEGEYVDEGNSVAEITVLEEYSDNNKITAFIPSESIQALETGMSVQVSPDFAPREKYGYMKGYISQIGKYPENGERIIQQYNTEELKPIINENENYIVLEITLIPDEESENGIEWSNPKGNSLPVNIGTICKGSVVISESTPYEWFLK